MPLSCNAHARAKFWLEGDADTPMKDRCVFLIKYMTVTEHQRHQSLLDQIAQSPDDRSAYSLAREALSVGIVGWQNLSYPVDHPNAGQPLPFDLDLLFSTRVLTEQELWALVRMYPYTVRPVETDLKNSASPPPSDPAPSVAPASPSA